MDSTASPVVDGTTSTGSIIPRYGTNDSAQIRRWRDGEDGQAGFPVQHRSVQPKYVRPHDRQGWTDPFRRDLMTVLPLAADTARIRWKGLSAGCPCVVEAGGPIEVTAARSTMMASRDDGGKICGKAERQAW
jgi:hypothetical protein